jgi:uncharacterized membrane protein
VTTAILILLAFAGFLVSLYFTGIYYNILRSDIWWIPRVCRIEESTCLSILKTPEARIFGLPNFVLGLIFYLLIIAAAVTETFGASDFLFDLILSIALFTVVLAVYLIYSLTVKLKTPCVLCYTAHAINSGIALLLVLIKYNIL